MFSLGSNNSGEHTLAEKLFKLEPEAPKKEPVGKGQDAVVSNTTPVFQKDKMNVVQNSGKATPSFA